ncbi:MAG: phage neck terminator protein [Sulfobacillus sp.]
MASPTLYVPSITVDDVFDALGAFIAPFVTASIIRCQVNRVAYPVGDFVELTEIANSDIEYPRQWYDTVNLQRDIIGPKRITIQADFYGELAGDWCAAIKTVWKTGYAVTQFPDGIAPLYCDDGHEAPLITGEEQYERRWALTCTLQYNPVVVVPLQSADTLAMNVVNAVDA